MGADGTATTTREHLLLAAGKLFSEHGFDSTSTRAIAEASGANLAAIHYHFGSKEALFLAVLEMVCSHHQQALSEQAVLERLDTPTEVARTIRTRVRAMFAILTGPQAVPWQTQLILHEMTQPSTAHAQIVDFLVAPLHARWVALHRHVRPQADAVSAHVWALHLPAMMRLMMTGRHTLERLIPADSRGPAMLEETVRQIADAMILLLGLMIPDENTP